MFIVCIEINDSLLGVIAYLFTSMVLFCRWLVHV